jgi:hypothetical protein
MKAELNYVEGDLFKGIQGKPGTILIPHICNDLGGWGAGFVIPLGRTFPSAASCYKAWYLGTEVSDRVTFLPDSKFRLGRTQVVNVQIRDGGLSKMEVPKIVVFNMIAQDGYGPGRVVRYNALAHCMDEVYAYAMNYFKVTDTAREIMEPEKIAELEPEIHAPMFGAGLGGGDWNFIQELIKDSWTNRGLKTTIYYLPGTLPDNFHPESEARS